MIVEAFPRRVPALLISGLVALATLAGCGSGEPTVTPTEQSLAEQAPDPAGRCGFTGDVEKVVIPTPDGLKLAGARIGSGPHGVVLLHQRGADMCGWSTAADALTKAGFHLLAIDMRCVGYSECDQEGNDSISDGTHDLAADGGAAVAALRQAGATKVVIMGASLGGATALVTGGRFADQVSGVVGLSVFSQSFNASASTTTEVKTPQDAASRITTPMLLTVSTGDGSSISPGAAQALIDAGSAKAAGKVIVREGSTHGWDMLRSTDVNDEVIAFLKANT